MTRCRALPRLFGLLLALLTTGLGCQGDYTPGGEAAEERPGAPTAPIDAPVSASERCDGFDDDGDGQVDEDCPCVPGATQACFPGPARYASEGAPALVGSCRMGTQRCEAPTGAEFDGRWGACEGAVTPTEEICGDGLDQDCDGKDAVCADPCASPALESVSDTLSFGNPGGCPWGSNGNLSPKDPYMRARVEQVQTLKLPQGARICRMEFEIPGQGIWYDDYLWVAFNDVLLMSSLNFSGLSTLKKQGDLVFYSWEALKGAYTANLGTGPAPYCLGQDQGLGSCTLPGSETSGTIAFKLDPSIVKRLGELAVIEGRYELKVVSTGDNDSTDCSHLPFTFQVKTYYVRN